MKTKIIVSSSSSINYINHSNNIISLPEVIIFDEYEKYIDYEQIEYDEFYQRFISLENCKPKFEALPILDIKKIIDKTLQTCDRVILLINNDDKINSIKSLISVYNNVYFYETDAFGYILANMAIMLDKYLNKEELNIDNAIKKINEIKKNSFDIIINYDQDFSVGDIKNINFEYKINKSTFYYYNASGSTLKKENIFDRLVRIFNEYANNESGIVFIEYSKDDSAYIDIIENKVLTNTKYRIDKKIPFSPATGIKYGSKIISLGFIKGENK